MQSRRLQLLKIIVLMFCLLGFNCITAKASGEYILPDNYEAYAAAYEGGQREFYLSTSEDFISAQTLCADSRVEGFAGVTLVVASPSQGSSGIWDITSIEGFTGIGTEENPFRGEFYCFYGKDGGVSFATDKPMLAYVGDGAEVSGLNINVSGACAGIAGNISGAVTIYDIIIEGTIENTSGSAGTVAASISDGAAVDVSELTSTAGVSGVSAGGIAGEIGQMVTITLGDNVAIGTESSKLTISGTESAGGYAGAIVGDHTIDLAAFSTKVYTSVVAEDAASYAGQLVGRLAAGNTESVVSVVSGAAVTLAVTGDGLTLTGANSIAADVSGTGNGGGLIGLCGNNAKITLSEGSLTVSGSIVMTDGYAGGVAAVLEQPALVLSSYTVSATVEGNIAGGIAGEMSGGKCIIDSPMISGTVTASECAGGLLGYICNSAAVELQGKITVGSAPVSDGIKGQIVARTEMSSDLSLIYLAGVEGKTDGEAQLTALAGVEEIGEYGGVFRNQNTGDGGLLIGDGTLEKVGVLNNTAAVNGTSYQLASVADFESLAIVLWTDGAFGTEVFNEASYTELLAASYEVTGSADISYEKTGIVTLNRNDVDDAGHAFSGKLTGTGEGITITQNSNVAKKYIGVFSTITGAVELSDLTFDGKIENATGAGGIAFKSMGSGLKLTDVTVLKEFANNSDYVGGVLAKEMGSDAFTLSAENVTLASTIDAGDNVFYSGFVTYMQNATVDLADVVLGGSLTCTNAEEPSGAFLGKEWDDIGGIVDGLTVTENTTYSAMHQFGVLFDEVVSVRGERLILKDIKLDNLEVTGNGESHCGLLVLNAKDLVLEVIDYDSTGCVVNKAGWYFDEIAGKVKFDNENYGGIVSIHSTTADFPAYHYENKATYNNASSSIIRNNRVSYFYDVFQKLENEDGTVNTANMIGKDNVLDNTAKVLLWDVVHYAVDGSVRGTFDKYFEDGDAPSFTNPEVYTFKGTLDLSEISYYPVPLGSGTFTGEDNATIIFGAETDTVDMSEWKLSNTDSGCQHYRLQSGLFYNPGALNIENITLSGKIANLGDNSGALVTGHHAFSQGTANITNITLKDLWIADYTDEAAGLLISKIPEAAVTFDGITMEGYPTDSDTKAAAALIGSAGSSEADALKLDFLHMVIADDKDEDSSNAHNGDVLKYASFLYNYTYTNDASVNTGYGLYLFSEADNESGIVTYGEELDMTTEFSDSSKTVFSEGGAAPADLYKPYVYQTKEIEVNPKSGDILKGCGTYEDPYVIENAKQFLTLYRYMNETGTEGDYQYQTFYTGWKVIAVGDDSTFCSGKHNVVCAVDGSFSGSGYEDAKVFGETGFPTPDEMSRAYYRLDGDIDLTQEMSTTYEQIAADFVGFGTAERPFVGVWYGRDSEGNVSTVTFPEMTSESVYSTYGFIQYAKGAVIKDIIIKSAATEEASVNWETSAKINTMGGGAIACILGGDNIIDNVTVEVDYWSYNTAAMIGGYVGNVKKGGLILRNVSDTALVNFRCGGESNKAIGAIAGSVEDGYIVCEDGEESGSYLWSGKGGNTAYNQVSDYNVLNINAMKSVLTLSIEEADNNIIRFNMGNSADLQLAGMALNADALNVRPSDYSKYADSGYTEKSRCRKAAYSDIGCEASCEDYVAAASYDNVMSYSAAADTAYAYPYLYDYMGVSYMDYFTEISGKGYSILNPAESIASVDYHIEWVLTASDTTYDMSEFGQSFRGIGAVYQTGNGYGGTFHGDFYGNNNTINLNLSRYVPAANVESAWRVGFFNTLYAAEAAYKESADFAEPEGSENIIDCFVIKDIILTGVVNQNFSRGEVHAGGLAANITNGNYAFSNIHADGLEVIVVSNSGGLIGKVESTGSYIHISNCSFEGNVKGHYAMGGLVAHSKASIMKIVDSEVMDTTVMRYSNRSAAYNVGGMIGTYDNNNGALILYGTESSPTAKLAVTGSTVDGQQSAAGIIGCAICKVVAHCVESNNNTITANTQAGGFIGRITTCGLSINEAYSEGNTIGAYRHMGGIVGFAEACGNEDSIIKATTIKNVVTAEENLCDATMSGIGGIIGRNERNLTIADVVVEGTVEEGEYQCRLAALGNKQRTGRAGSGGLVGCHVNGTLHIADCTINTVLIETDTHYYGSGYTDSIGAGGLVGYVCQPVYLSGAVSTENIYVKAPNSSELVIEDTAAVAGGCFGMVAESAVISGEPTPSGDMTYYQGLSAIGNTVSGEYAGGLIGYINNGTTNVRLEGVNVQNGQVTSDEVAGGVFGYVCPSYKGTALNVNDSKTVNSITNMTVSGRVSGGVIGNLAITGPIRMECVTLDGNTIIASQYVVGEECSAGGVCGQISANSSEKVTLSMYDVTLSNNFVVGEVAATTLSADEIDKFAVGGVIGRTAFVSDKFINVVCFDGFNILTTNQIGIRAENSDDVMLVKREGDTYTLSEPVLPASAEKHYDAISQLVTEYGYYVGTIAGAVQASNLQIYMLNTTEDFVTPVMANNPPVTDVGRYSEETVDAYRSYCHIIYGENPSESKYSDTNLEDMKAETDKLNASYTGSETLVDLLLEYRLPEATVELFLDSYQSSYTFSGSDISINTPIIVYKAENGELQKVLEDISDVMTNMAGASSSDIDESYLKITCTPKLYNGNTVMDGEAGTASVSATIVDGEVQYTSSSFDGIEGDYLTCTEITYNYGWATAHKKVFTLLVFVEEPILYSVHTRLMEGRISDVETIRAKGVTEDATSVIMANDSDYTMLLEYTYGQARKEMPDGVSVDKVFYLEAMDKPKALPVGTRLLLIDVTAGNKPYYYTVTGEVTRLNFSDFKDAGGKAYVNRDINDIPDEADAGASYYTDLAGHKLTEVGVERYLLTVLSADDTSGLYTINAGLDVADELTSRLVPEDEHEEEISLEITAVPGLEIYFAEKGNLTDISGAISKDETLTVKGLIRLEAEAIYWTEKNKPGAAIIDSSNNGKYLELAFYLRDSGGSRVRLPEGTNFSYKLGDGNYGESKVIPDTSLIYYYKDIRNAFGEEDSYYKLSSLESNTDVAVEFKLDFAGSEFGDVADARYTAWLELLRTGNMDYPMGNDSKLDSYSELVTVNGLQQFGFAIRAKDLSTLAINAYPIATSNTIPCSIMFDFSEILAITGGSGKNQVLAKWADYDYEVTYKIYKKEVVGTSFSYVEYTGEDVTITANEEASSTGELVTIYNFAADDIEAGNGASPVAGVLSFDCNVKLDTETMAKTNANFTNYRIEAKLTVKEKDADESGTKIEETIDFIIFTLTKLKTDI